MHFESGVGHIGGNLSCLDLLLCLYHERLRERDRFVLSKGHAAGALYVTLWSRGLLSERDLGRFHGEGTPLAGHPGPGSLPDIRFATGSLGHGLPVSAGIALGKKLRGEPGEVFCLMSDGEWDEGSNWEALLFAAHHKLERLVFIVDHNGLQGFGSVKEVADLGSLAEKFRAFGVSTEEIDGHDLGSISAALAKRAAGPRAIVARTTKGCGVSFMEGRMEWHYLPMTRAQYEQAARELR
ncbi:MAG: transketolase [Elusimicrobia bacterium]|nr:transketolase [Elusimicrobiota bacterium]